MSGKRPPISIGRVIAAGSAGFRAHTGSLLTGSALAMAVPAMVLFIQAADFNFWLGLAIWLLSLVLAGYSAWPLARTALAAVSNSQRRGDDWWVRDGFVRATAIFLLTAAVGTVFLFVPGVMVLMIYSLYPFVIVEKKAKGLQALALSSGLSRGNRMRLLGLILVCMCFFVPAGATLYLWDPGPLVTLGFWLLGIPALAASFTTMAAAYRAIARA